MDDLGRFARGRATFGHALCAVLMLLAVAPWGRAQAQCIDEAIRDELNARRQYRGVQERLFQKARRHEVSVLGGAYAADLMSSSWLVGGTYTYHFSEDLGLEAMVARTESRSEVIAILEDELGTDLVRDRVPVWLYQGHLIWTLAYGKMRWFGSRISRFDFGLALGGGITDNQSARSLTFSGGLGLKFYPAPWLAVRVDLRDQVLTQELLGDARIVNNLIATLGLSVFLPFGF